jgi:ribosomal protein S18 acetylase RimI-like enzyme
MIIQVDREAIGVIRIEIRPECLFIHEIQILPSWQNKGIATKLLQEEITRACKLTLPVRLKVLRYNRAYKLYRRLGFSIIGTQRATYLMEYNAANSRLRTIAVKYKLDQLASKVVHCVLRGKAVTRSVLRRISNLRRRIGGGCVARRDI